MKRPPKRKGAETEIKAVLIVMFEPRKGGGELTRFRRGLKLQPWHVDRFKPGILWRNQEGVAALVAGVGPVNTAVNVLAMGLHAGVDWRKTYWLVCGIAGGNPNVCSLGSPMFAEWVVDGDLALDLHPHDCPPEWTTGLLPLGAQKPFGPRDSSAGLFGQPAQVFHLNRKLAAWAQKTARDVPLYDSASLAKLRRNYQTYTDGARPPTVGMGDVLSAARFWHGPGHHAWAERWVKYWTKGCGQFATASMEDSGTLGALWQLHLRRLVDWRRVLVVRSVSNYTIPPPGQSAHRHLAGQAGIHYPGLKAAHENGWRVGSAVLRELLAGKQ